MWQKPWGYKEGFAICGGLFLTGTFLQITIGKCELSILSYPMNVCVGVLYLVILLLIYAFSQKSYFIRWMGSCQAAVSSMVSVAMLTVVMGLSVAQAMQKTGIEVSIKWPNDVVMSRRKICGILTEMGLNGTKIREVVIGVGINVNLKEIPSELQDKATSLYLETGKTYDRIQILAQVLECFEENYETFIRTCSLSGMVEEYNKLLANRNQPVRILDPNQPWEGTALGINEQGELLVKDEQGTIQTVRAGEVSVRGLYSYV